MIFGTGIDIVEIGRMRSAIKRYGTVFVSKVFTDREIAYASKRRIADQHFAARFAAKEAVIKAFGEPNKFPVRWTDIEVLNDDEGKPYIAFHGSALAFKRKKGIGDIVVSMSHSKNYAIASVIVLKGKK